MTEATAKVAAPSIRSISAAGRYRGLAILALGGAVGIAAGGIVSLMGWITNELHVLLYGLATGARLSALAFLVSPWLAFVPAVGGLLMGITFVLSRRFRTRPPVDPIEANAVYGGRMSFRESLLVAGQTMISSGFGASVGLEAAYTQMGSAVGSKLAIFTGLRRNEVRTLVGCGAAGAIAAAFGAPLTGAFYAFELIIGVYSISVLAPVMIAALAGYLVALSLGGVQTPIEVGPVPALGGWDALPFLVLGLVGGGAAIAIMRLVTVIDGFYGFLRVPSALRPLTGGLLVGCLALATPQVLSSGHGALHIELTSDLAVPVLGALFLLKAIASAVSLGSGFRGGLFFASLFLGALLGKAVALALVDIGVPFQIEPTLWALVGMASLAVGVVGGPLTMSFLVLETTSDLAITIAVLAASISASVLVRETFGFSFSTWRLHLRGETIRGAHDVGRLRNLTVGRMMRKDVRTVPADMSIAAFRELFPLGSTERVIAVGADGRYAGIVLVADAYARRAGTHDAAERPLETLLKYTDQMLVPTISAERAAELFDQTHGEELAVVDDLVSQKVIGLLTEAHLLRRYAEELEKSRQDLAGEA
jgi:CIC family chloride channel protein